MFDVWWCWMIEVVLGTNINLDGASGIYVPQAE